MAEAVGLRWLRSEAEDDHRPARQQRRIEQRRRTCLRRQRVEAAELQGDDEHDRGDAERTDGAFAHDRERALAVAGEEPVGGVREAVEMQAAGDDDQNTDEQHVADRQRHDGRRHPVERDEHGAEREADEREEERARADLDRRARNGDDVRGAPPARSAPAGALRRRLRRPPRRRRPHWRPRSAPQRRADRRPRRPWRDAQSPPSGSRSRRRATPADSKVAISSKRRRLVSASAIPRHAPVPSPSRISRSRSGDASSAARIAA